MSKRVAISEKKSVPLWVYLSAVIILVPLVVPVIGLVTFFKGVGDALWYSWNRMAQEVESVGRQIRSAR